MRELLPTIDAWRAEGRGFGRAVLIRVFGNGPRPEGATLLVADDGSIAGSVSGGCVEGAAAELIAEARQDGCARVVRFGISDEQAWGVGLACGSTIDVLIEPELRPEVEAAARASVWHCRRRRRCRPIRQPTRVDRSRWRSADCAGRGDSAGEGGHGELGEAAAKLVSQGRSGTVAAGGRAVLRRDIRAASTHRRFRCRAGGNSARADGEGARLADCRRGRA